MNNLNKSEQRFSKIRMAIGIAGIAAFSIILYCMINGYTSGIDDIRYIFYDMRNDVLTPIVKAMTYLGNSQSIITICFILLIVKRTRTTYGIPVSVGAIIVTVLNKVIKHLVERPRPDDIVHLVNAGGFSFSSGHSITSMFVFGMLIYLVRANMKNRKAANILTVVLAVPMICIGLSRIYLGVHYPTDVLAGWCLGITVIMFMIEIIRRYKKDL